LMTYSTTVENPLQIAPIFFKTKPICRPAKMELSLVAKRDYEEKYALRAWPSKAKQTQFQC